MKESEAMLILKQYNFFKILCDTIHVYNLFGTEVLILWGTLVQVL